MKNVRLFQSSTIVGDVQGTESTSAKLTKRALLVYTGKFESMDGEVEVTDDHITKLAENHNATCARLAAGKPTMADYPPVQVDHSTSAWDTAGRVVGPVEVGEHDGKKALYGNLTFLGSEAVDRVNDGRWTHLSLGADLEAGKINEMTVTPFPAAPNASLLAKGNSRIVELPGHVDESLWQKAKDASKKAFGEIRWPFVSWWYQQQGGKFSKETHLSQGAEMHPDHEKMKKHLMDKEKLSEKDADDKLSKMTDDEKKELAGKVSDAEKLASVQGNDTHELPADDKHATPKDDSTEGKKLSAAKKKFATLTKGFKENSGKAKLSVKKVQLSARITKLRSEGKITPVEQKAIDLDKLAALDDAATETIFEIYGKRQPVVLAGSYGVANAEPIANLAKDVKDKKMMAEMMEGMHFSRSMVKRLAGSDPGKPMPTSMDVHEQMGGEEIGHPMPTSMDVHEQLKKGHEHLHRLLEEGKHDEAKEHLKKMMAYHCKHMEEPGPTDAGHGGMPETQPAHLSALAESVEKLQNQFEELVNLATPILGEE